MVFGKFDGILNETKFLKPKKYPMMVLYSKKNKMGVTYNGSLDIVEIKEWLNKFKSQKEEL